VGFVTRPPIFEIVLQRVLYCSIDDDDLFCSCFDVFCPPKVVVGVSLFLDFEYFFLCPPEFDI